MLDETAVHILGGGIGGTVGAILTCPLEVVKVRLQSSRGSILCSASENVSIATVTPVITATTNRHSTRIVRRILSTVSLHNRNDLVAERQEHPSPSNTSCNKSKIRHSSANESYHLSSASFSNAVQKQQSSSRTGFRRSVLVRCLADISRTEGIRALFKGLLPTLVGVLPSRGIYFCAYHKGQLLFESRFSDGSSGVFLCAAGFGSITASSLTNPIWYVKTRLQLDSRPGLTPITVGQVIRNTWQQEGIRGFYRGVSASYVGSLETALNFVIYENVKSELLWWDLQRRTQQQQQQHPHFSLASTSTYTAGTSRDLRGSRGGSKLNASSDMLLCMMASAFSKAVAITVLYPHEVVRTRLREADGRYRGFFRTLRRVYVEEGYSGLYRGMGTHYIRQVPNSCIMIGTYEMVVFLLQSWGLTKIP
ncbi:Solute carrier 25 member 36-A [Clonorchis sinensis]|uniref:Solute carrier 25 member 36-A n=2 Tax=Clonorchis sinensis TaxID=79923 RepID=A0A3R7H9H6_CLOSI|nr:Solute carrier 25 member 36-A [Clonorchis sinensis]